MTIFVIAAIAFLAFTGVLGAKAARTKRGYVRNANYQAVRNAVLTQRGLNRMEPR